MKTISTPTLAIEYFDHGSPQDPPIVLSHGWPDSVRCWDQVWPSLVNAGFRVLIPALRGFSGTKFLKPEAPRTGELASLGRDLVDFVDALGLVKPVLVGHDWGARASANAVGLRPDLASALVMISVGYGTNLPGQAISFTQAKMYWYHWFMATETGQAAIANDREGFARHMWESWAPKGWFEEEEFTQTAKAFDNEDWTAITLSSYQHRWGHGSQETHYPKEAAALAPPPQVHIPTLMLHGALDGASLPSSSEGKERYFEGVYERIVLDGVGHFPPREVPDLLAHHILKFLGTHCPS